MTVYVDTMKAPYGRMIMCHMIADTTEELHVMADKIGINRKWFQAQSLGHTLSHYDICQSKRHLALKFGAVEIDRKQLVEIIRKHGRKANAQND
jgi:hypothetical protein